MPQEQFAQRGTRYKTFEQKSDTALRISLAVGLTLLGALGIAQWASSASTSNAAAKSTASHEARTTAEPVYKCADGRVSFTPCS